MLEYGLLSATSAILLCRDVPSVDSNALSIPIPGRPLLLCQSSRPAFATTSVQQQHPSMPSMILLLILSLDPCRVRRPIADTSNDAEHTLFCSLLLAVVAAVLLLRAMPCRTALVLRCAAACAKKIEPRLTLMYVVDDGRKVGEQFEVTLHTLSRAHSHSRFGADGALCCCAALDFSGNPSQFATNLEPS